MEEPAGGWGLAGESHGSQRVRSGLYIPLNILNGDDRIQGGVSQICQR